MAVSRLLDVLERLQHFGNEVLTNLDEAGMLRLLLRADELAVRALKVALDGVVLEVGDGLGFVLNIVVARGGGSGRSGRLCQHGRRRSQSHSSEKSETDDEWLLHDSVLLSTAGGPAPGGQTTQPPGGSVQNPTCVAFIKPP